VILVTLGLASLSIFLFTETYQIISAIIVLGCLRFVYSGWKDVIQNIRYNKSSAEQLNQLRDTTTIPKEALDDIFKQAGLLIVF
jgi:hypothetical protein